MSDFSFADPIPVDSLPPSARGGRTSKEPAFRAWLAKLQPNQTYELPSEVNDEEGEFKGQPMGHPVSRVTALRKIAGDEYKVDTRPIEGQSGKRYRMFVTKTNPKANAAKK